MQDFTFAIMWEQLSNRDTCYYRISLSWLESHSHSSKYYEVANSKGFLRLSKVSIPLESVSVYGLCTPPSSNRSYVSPS